MWAKNPELTADTTSVKNKNSRQLPVPLQIYIHLKYLILIQVTKATC